MTLNSPSADPNAEPTKFLISTLLSAFVKEVSLTSTESVEAASPTLFTAHHLNHANVFKDMFLMMEIASLLLELQFQPSLFQFPPALVDLTCSSLTKSAFVKRDSSLLVVHARNALTEPISMLPLKSAELLVKLVKSTTE
jgi:hypothetical protein